MFIKTYIYAIKTYIYITLPICMYIYIGMYVPICLYIHRGSVIFVKVEIENSIS